MCLAHYTKLISVFGRTRPILYYQMATGHLTLKGFHNMFEEPHELSNLYSLFL